MLSNLATSMRTVAGSRRVKDRRPPGLSSATTSATTDRPQPALEQLASKAAAAALLPVATTTSLAKATTVRAVGASLGPPRLRLKAPRTPASASKQLRSLHESSCHLPRFGDSTLN